MGAGLNPSKIDAIGFNFAGGGGNIIYITDLGFKK